MKPFSDHQQLRDWLSLNNAIDNEAGQIPCRQAPDLFFPEKIGTGAGFDGGHLKMAIKACHSCPVMKKCAEYAVNHKEVSGIWGGLTSSERKRIWSKKA
jgi:WhiB family redox-sensing transcriptional regulator